MLPDAGYFDYLPLKYNTARFNELEPLFSDIIHAFSDNPRTNQPRVKAALLNIMKIIHEELNGNQAIPLGNRTANQYYERVMSCKQYIDEHPGEKLSLETLALQFGSSPSFSNTSVRISLW